MATRTCVILNLKAGSAGDPDERRAQLDTLLRTLGDITVLETKEPGDAERLARRAVDDGFERVVAAGGDGTVNSVLNGIAGGAAGVGALDRVELGVLPLGTGNDLANTLRMPREERGAIEALGAWRSSPVDVVRLIAHGAEGGGRAERLLLNMSSGGFVQIVGESADPASKRGALGSVSYIISAAKALGELKEYDLTLTIDGGPARRIRAYATMISNGRTVGGGLVVAPDAAMDDGRIEVMVVPAIGVAQLAMVGAQVVAGGGGHTESEQLVFGKGSRVELKTDPAMPVSADGEVVEVGEGPPSRVTYEVMARALRVVFGPEAEVESGG